MKLTESYKDFDWQIIKDYCFNLESQDTSKLKDLDDVYDFLNDYFEPLQVEFQWYREYSDEMWKDNYVQNGTTYSNGIITVYCDLQNILDALTGTAYRKECITSIAAVVVHELMHRYQVTQYQDRKWDKVKTEDDYLAHKDEISAHIVGGVTELLGMGYTKEQLKKALTTMDADLDKARSPFRESNSLYVYWDRFGSFDPQDKVWLRFKKELANFILGL